MHDKYKVNDYFNYKDNLTIKEMINNLNYIKEHYLDDYNFTGEDDDYKLFNLYVTIDKVIELINTNVVTVSDN